MAERKEIPKPQLIAEAKARKDIEGLVAFLGEGETLPVRRLAADALLSIGNADALNALGEMLAAPSAGLSESILDRLALLPGLNACRLIARGFGASDPIWRNRVIDALRKRIEPEVFGLLLPACRDRSGAIRQLALRLVLKMLTAKPACAKGVSADRMEPIFAAMDIKEVIEFLRKGPPTVKCAAIARLGGIATPLAYLTLAEAFASEGGEVGEAALSALEQAREAPAEYFRPLVRHPDESVRLRALDALVERAGEDACGDLEPMLQDASASVRAAALRHLVNLQGVGAMGQVAGALVDTEADVRRTAVDLLVQWPGAETTEMLKLVTGDPDADVRWRAFLALARHNVTDPALGPSYIQILTEIAGRENLTSEDVDGLCAIASSLSGMGGELATQALDSLEAAAKSASLRLRRVAVEGILRYPVKQRVDALAGMVDTYDKSILKIAAKALGEAKDKRGIVPLIRVVDECGGKPADEARELLAPYKELKELDFLVALLKNRWISVRRYAAEHLGHLGDKRSIDPLLEALGDEDVELQFASILGLKRFAAEERVSERLIETIEYGDLSVRQMAAEALGEQKVTAAVPMLIRALSNPFVRPYAERALREIGDRKGYLAVRRRQIREKYFNKKLKPAELARKAEAEKKAKMMGRSKLSVE
jgi:HEAT repeat protein